MSERDEETKPRIVWVRPLTPCGPEENPGAKLLGQVRILGVSFHAEAYEVRRGAEGRQVAASEHDEDYLTDLLGLVEGNAQTVTIGGREYVFAITPHQR